ncbi:hypothetical protein SAMN05216232_0185 [Virgibacillus subterraneus]|uniref:DUF4054 domain-containing protein n=1 Tax=Virgibacillus subterraneus TaxID=621109 RepID=A0A1H8YY04_9BACI|nr:hypothetical protein [Virgibacillus subterraneus]SEP56917.1 hypothetical protein SAMN05216232_0185 [Virgibacillus subterraneus]
MPYIDKAYYDDTYKGTPVEDVAEFNRLAQRSSEVIDQLTSYTIANYEFTQLATFLQDQVKKAVCAQVEHYALNGGYDAVNAGKLSSVSIGSFNYTEKESKNNNSKISSDAVDFLTPTGLLYSGIGVANGC